MNRIQIIAGASLFTALTLGGAAVAATNTPAASVAATCQVSVDRSQAAGSFQVDRQTLSNGECVCYVYTGPETPGSAAEGRIADLRSQHDCGAPSSALATSDSNSDRKKKLPVILLGSGLGIGGIIAAFAAGGGHNNDSTGG